MIQHVRALCWITTLIWAVMIALFSKVA